MTPLPKTSNWDERYQLLAVQSSQLAIELNQHIAGRRQSLAQSIETKLQGFLSYVSLELVRYGKLIKIYSQHSGGDLNFDPEASFDL
jgi:hypothetical protein